MRLQPFDRSQSIEVKHAVAIAAHARKVRKPGLSPRFRQGNRVYVVDFDKPLTMSTIALIEAEVARFATKLELGFEDSLLLPFNEVSVALPGLVLSDLYGPLSSTFVFFFRHRRQVVYAGLRFSNFGNGTTEPFCVICVARPDRLFCAVAAGKPFAINGRVNSPKVGKLHVYAVFIAVLWVEAYSSGLRSSEKIRQCYDVWVSLPRKSTPMRKVEVERQDMFIPTPIPFWRIAPGSYCFGHPSSPLQMLQLLSLLKLGSSWRAA